MLFCSSVRRKERITKICSRAQKIYKNKFDIRPATIDIKTLTLGTMPGTTGIPSDGFGIGHVPLSRQVFESWKPIFVGFENVSEEELEGYKMWQADLHN